MIAGQSHEKAFRKVSHPIRNDTSKNRKPPGRRITRKANAFLFISEGRKSQEQNDLR